MSLATWKKEFYPVKPTKKMSAIDAVKHSLQKWEGLKARNLKKHEVTSYGHELMDEDGSDLSISSRSCALCVKFLQDNPKVHTCEKCPLYISRGNYSCDTETPKEEELDIDFPNKHPFSQWVDSDNPLPMIRDLKKALKMLEREELEK